MEDELDGAREGGRARNLYACQRPGVDITGAADSRWSLVNVSQK